LINFIINLTSQDKDVMLLMLNIKYNNLLYAQKNLSA